MTSLEQHLYNNTFTLKSKYTLRMSCSKVMVLLVMLFTSSQICVYAGYDFKFRAMDIAHVRMEGNTKRRQTSDGKWRFVQLSFSDVTPELLHTLLL